MEKPWKNLRKHKDIKFVTTEKRRNCLVSEPNYHTTKFFTKNLLGIKTKKTEILMNKPAYLGLSVLELSKILMYEFWYDYVEPGHGEKPKLSYMNTDSFIVYIKINDIHKDIAEDIETRYDNSNYELDRLLPKGKNKKVIGLMKDELRGKIMIKFVGSRRKSYSYLIDDGSEHKKAKGAKRYVKKKTYIW